MAKIESGLDRGGGIAERRDDRFADMLHDSAAGGADLLLDNAEGFMDFAECGAVAQFAVQTGRIV